ncbi:terminase small subunit [Halomonas denitrificans]|uniref:terminase small subunit n=1 Tax=Halomonas denitrificans TaxID=370769 RepID=UPI001CD5CB5B|nr:terminase small subunit [Halomonas denitrificans]MCA0973418.1 terminase small subunit [Halomonas denitrificans]
MTKKTAREAVALTARQSRFVDEYLKDLSATQAAIRAGYSKKTAGRTGYENLKKPEIAREIQARMNDRSQRTQITADRVLQRWWEIATADAAELTQVRRGCCRHCHGDDHGFQWKDEEEFFRAVACAEMGREPNDTGGYGFREFNLPHPECPECGGEGVPRVYAEDTRKLTGSAKLLFAGVKQTKDGLEVKMQDQSKALENVARHLGMFTDRVDHVSSDGSMTPKPTTIQLVAPNDDSDA